jgi:hypothetical protein
LESWAVLLDASSHPSPFRRLEKKDDNGYTGYLYEFATLDREDRV